VLLPRTTHTLGLGLLKSTRSRFMSRKKAAAAAYSIGIDTGKNVLFVDYSFVF